MTPRPRFSGLRGAFNLLTARTARVSAQTSEREGTAPQWLGAYVKGGKTTPITTKTIGAYGMSIDVSMSARKELRGSDVDLALACASNPIANQCVRLRAQKVSEMPRKLVNKQTREVITEHPFLDALKLARLYYRHDVFYHWQHSKCVHGEAYFEKVPNPSGVPLTLRWLNPIAVEPHIVNGMILYYEFNTDDWYAAQQLAPDTVIYDKYHNPLDDYRGLAPMQLALNGVNIHNDYQKYVKSFFQNDATPGGLLTARQGTIISATEQQRLVEEWNKGGQGAKKRFMTRMLPAPLEYQQVQQPPAPEYIQLEKSATAQICAAFGVPLPLVEYDENRFQLSQEHEKNLYENIIIPECEDMLAVINDEMLPYFDDSGDVEFEWDFDKIRAMIDDQTKRASAINARLQTGNMTINEARNEFGQAPVDGGDTFYIPKAVLPVPLEELPNLADLIQPMQNQPDAPNLPKDSNTVNEGRTAAERELKNWKAVTLKSLNRGRNFRIEYLGEETAKRIREQLFALPAKASAESVKAVFTAALVEWLTLADETA